MTLISITRTQMLKESTGKWHTCGKYEVVKYESRCGTVSSRSLGFYSKLSEAKAAVKVARETSQE
jgi:hypothetical protein